MSILAECANMVKGMADYYSDEKLDLSALEEALRPFVGHLGKDSPGYLNIKAEREQIYKEESE